MKKYILLLGVLCLGLVSCVKEDMPQQDGMVTFSAVYNDAPATKTVLEGLTPYWNPTDKISVYDGKNNEFSNTSSSVSATTKFKGTLEGKGRNYYLAAYPYDADLTFSFLSKTVYGIIIPTEQTAVAGSYDPVAAPAIAYTEDFALSFKNVCSLIKFKIISDGVQSVTVKANAGENLAGKFNSTWGDSPRITVTGGEKTITLKGDFKKGETYYISALPMVLTEGMEVVLNNNVVTMKETYQIDLARSGMVNLGDLSLNPSESQKPTNPEEDEDDAVASDWVLVGMHCGWDPATATPMYEIGENYVAFDVPAAAAAGFKFKNGDTWIGTTATVSVDKWVAAQGEGGGDIAFTAQPDAAYDIYFTKDTKAFYITAAGSAAPEAIPAPFTGKSVAGNFNSWSNSANPMTAEGDYYVVKGLQLASTNLADPTSNGFKFVDVKGADQATWYGAGTSSIELGKWYATKVDGSLNICINGDATALYDAYISKDMTTFCVVAAGSEIPSKDEVGDDKVETVGTIYMKPNSSWMEAGARFAAYFFEGDANTWMSMTDADGDGVYECGVPSGYSNVIFTRMNPASSDNNWDNKWNQTSDLKIPTDGTNFYTVKEGTWDNGGGTWSTFGAGSVDPTPTPEPDPTPGETPGEDPTPEPDPTPDTKPVRIYLSTAWGWPYIWCWDSAGAQIFAGASWPGTKYHGEENGYYYWDVPEAYVGKTVSMLAVKGDKSEQTSDFNNVVLDKSVYFYLEWTSEKGCHLIQENK